ncbi:MAG: MBG domain-containing protein [Luteolibacter sp.]
MPSNILKYMGLLLLAWLRLCGVIQAETTAVTLSGLPNFVSADIPESRIDTLTVTLDPDNNALHGKPGETLGWGFNISWASNAGDRIIFTGSELMENLSEISATGYKDIIGRNGGNTNRSMTAGTDWASPFVANTTGVGYLTVNAYALPGNSYTGELRIYCRVYDTATTPSKLRDFYFSVAVTVTVDPVDPVEQTITFAEIGNKNATDPAFSPSPTSTSNLPVSLVSLNPAVCAVGDDNTLVILSAGDCTILAMQEGNTAYKPATPVARMIKILKVPATVTINGSLDQLYDGNGKTFTTVTSPPNLPVKMLYSGSSTPPKDAGIYLVQALIDDPSYEGASQVMLTITDLTPPPVTNYNPKDRFGR